MRLLTDGITARRYLYQTVPVIAFSHQRRPLPSGRQGPDLLVAAFARQLLLQEQPDLIHAAHTMRGAEFLTVAAELGIPYLMTLTDFWVICPNCKLMNERRQRCHGPHGGNECRRGCPTFRQKQITQRLKQMQQLLQQATRVVAPSAFLAEKIEAEFNVPALAVIPYGIDTTALRPNERHYPTGDLLLFCFAGALLEAKGIRLLLQAFHLLSHENIRLEIYGTGPMLPQVQQAVQTDPRISYGGRYEVAQLNTLLNRIDITIVPSIWHENLPLIMQEAQWDQGEYP